METSPILPAVVVGAASWRDVVAKIPSQTQIPHQTLHFLPTEGLEEEEVEDVLLEVGAYIQTLPLLYDGVVGEAHY